jgi:hypothetical protein
MNLLLPGIEDEAEVSVATRTDIARDWCDPSSYSEIVGVDFGAKSCHYYMARSGQRGRMTAEQAAGWLCRLPAGTLVVCEWAHLAVPQTSRSLAQPFKAEQLLDLYRQLVSRGVTLKLAPHAHTGSRMRLWVSGRHPSLIENAEKTDAADALMLAVFVSECNEIALADPPRGFGLSLKRQYGRRVTERSNGVLNAERTDDYRGTYFPLLMKLARKANRKAGGGKRNEGLSASVVSTLACEQDGKLYLFTHRGHIPGRWFWMRDVLRMSAWHHRGGTARSNLMWHRFRPYAARVAERHGVPLKKGTRYIKVALMSEAQKAARRLAMRQFRQMLLAMRDAVIQIADKEMGAGRMELTDVEQEAIHGR